MSMKALIPDPAAMVDATLASRPRAIAGSQIELSSPPFPLSAAMQGIVPKKAANIA